MTVYSGRTGRQVYRIARTSSLGSCGFGGTIVGLGDTDGDGAGDLAVTGWQWGRFDQFSGKDGKFVRAYAQARACAKTGDVDGDGNADLIVTTPWSKSAAQHVVTIHSGATGKTIRSVTGKIAEFGSDIAGIGDVNGDKVPDFVVSSPRESKVYVYSGKDVTLLKVLTGTRSSPCRFGLDLSDAGDVDADGTPDFLVGDGLCAGGYVVHAISGKTFTMIRSFDSLLGKPIVGGCYGAFGDLDRDGHADVLVRTNYFEGLVGCLSGKTGELLREWTSRVHFNLGATPSGVAPTGDVDGDGTPDLVASETHKAFSAYAFLFSGALRTLAVDTPAISASKGGSAKFTLTPGSRHVRDSIHVLVGSWTGTKPGIPIGDQLLPLVPDFYFMFLLGSPNALIRNNIGLVTRGLTGAEATMTWPPNLANVLVGRTLFHAYVILNTRSRSFPHASNAASVRIDR